ncbi:MAG: flippase [Candidatus Aenigmarchaeota archaeon]|nr:flippase [Candidatus Aenigmarchaeota archaeon]
MEGIATGKYAEAVGRGTSLIFMFSMLAAAIGYGFRIFLSRSLAVDEFGLFYSVVAFIATIGVFRELGLATSLVKYISELKSKQNFAGIKSSIIMVFLAQTILSVAIFTPLIFFSDILASQYFGMPQASTVLFFLLIEAIVNMGIYSAVFQGMQKFKIFGLIEIFRVSILFAFAIPLASNGAVGIALAQLLTTLVMNVIFVGIAFKEMPALISEKFVFDTKLLRNVFKFGLTLWLGNIIVMLVSRLDIIFITYFRALKEVAWYNVSLPTAMLLTTFSAAVNNTLYPTVAELWANGRKEDVARGMESIIKFFFVLMLPPALVFLAYPDIIITTLFGESYLPASFSLQILSIGMLFSSISSIFLGVINGIGRPDMNAKVVSVVAGANFALNALLVPFYGLDGAAAATAISFGIMFLMTFTFLRNKMKMGMHFGDIGRIFLGGLIALLAVAAAKEALIIEDALIESAITFMISMTFYAAYLIAAKVMVKSDIELLETSGFRLPDSIKSLMLRILRN